MKQSGCGVVPGMQQQAVQQGELIDAGAAFVDECCVCFVGLAAGCLHASFCVALQLLLLLLFHQHPGQVVSTCGDSEPHCEHDVQSNLLPWCW